MKYLLLLLLLFLSNYLIAQDYVLKKEWMKYIDGSKMVSQLFIPGTHDSGTESISIGAARTQSKTISEQLNGGVRFFDIRIDSDDFRICHGTFDTDINFQDVMDDFIDFVQNHPSEALIVHVKKERGDTSLYNMQRTIQNDYINKYKYIENLIVNKTYSSPKLKEIRGKILFLFRSDNYTSYGSYVDFYNNTKFTNNYFDVQDYYDPAGYCVSYLPWPFSSTCIDWDRGEPKKDKITDHVTKRYYAQSSTRIFINFISISWTVNESGQGATETPWWFARTEGINDHAITQSKRLRDTSAGMIFVFDYINNTYAKEIIDLNF